MRILSAAELGCPNLVRGAQRVSSAISVLRGSTITIRSWRAERQWTRRWREMDSNFRFRAFLSLRSSSVFSIPRSRSAEGTDAESGTEAISR
jgi:hypothetical protein